MEAIWGWQGWWGWWKEKKLEWLQGDPPARASDSNGFVLYAIGDWGHYKV